MKTIVPKQKSRGALQPLPIYVVLVLLFFVRSAFAQADTTPVLLQQDPSWHTWNVGQMVARGTDSIIFTNTGTSSVGIWLSKDRGLTFSHRDSLVNTSLICLPASRRSGQTSYAPIWQFDSSGSAEFSTDYGLTWKYPTAPQTNGKSAVTADGISTDGDLFWYSTSQSVILTHSGGNTWDTLPFSAASGTLAWYDPSHGVRSLGGKLIARTHDGGATWDTVSLPGLITGALSYLTPNIIYIAPLARYPLINYVSLDTGRTWETINAFYSLQVVRDSLWYAYTTRGTVPNISNSLNAYFRSTDLGATWKPLSFQCPNGPTYLLFADSEHGVSLGTAQTDDGGYTWDCQDTTIYAGAAQYVIPGDFDPSAYYDLAAAHGTNYVCLSTNRGSTWTALFPYPTNVTTPWAIALGYRLFIADPDKIDWTDNGGQSFHTFKFNYGGSTAGHIQRTPDGTLWATNDLELYISRDSGNTWLDQSQNIPYRQDSFQLSYTFKPVDSITGFVKTSSGAIFRTTDAGLSWLADSIMPAIVVDSRHWFNGTKYTPNAGAKWRVLSGPIVTVPVDSLRWVAAGQYTTDAGSNWHPIPGWYAKPIQLIAVDSATAFAGGFPNGAFWRLDMPFYGTPKPVAPDFYVDNQTWKNVPFQMDTGWIQLPIVIHNRSITQAIQVHFDSISDPTHFALAPYQSAQVTVPKRSAYFTDDGLDSVWFSYHPTAFEMDAAKAYWHSPQVLKSDGSSAERTDSLYGNPSTASVSESANASLVLAPNPTTGIVIVRGSTGAITVTNVLGEIVIAPSQTDQIGDRNISLDLRDLPQGTYFAQIETIGGLIVRKIVKE